MKPRREAFKIGGKKLGQLWTWPSGRRCVVIERSMRDIHRGREARIAHALDEGVAMWAVETSILTRMRLQQVECIAIRVREDGAIHLTTLVRFARHGVFAVRRRRNGSAQRSLGFQHFLTKRGRIKL